MQQDPRRRPQQNIKQQPPTRQNQHTNPSSRPNPNTRQPSRSQSPQYRSAAPYTVAPRQGTQRVPYPTSEQQRRLMKRKKQRQRRVILLTAACLLCLLLLAGLITAAVLAIRSVLGGNPTTDPNVHPTPGVSGSIADTIGEPTEPPPPPETEPPLPDYSVPNKLPGKAVVPTWGDAVITLSDTISCQYVLFMDAETGRVIAEKNGHDTIYPASMTKLMTVLVAYESLPDLDATYRMTNEIIDPLYTQGLALAGFSGSEEITIRDLLYGSALPSGAEASYALALAACGSEEAFVEKMNARAAHLGMNGTQFKNCTGAHDPEHYSTLGDIAVLLAYIMQNEDLAEIFGTYQYTTAPTVQHPEGILMTSTVFSRIEGSESGVCTIISGKTGYTPQAGQCLVTYGKNDTTDKRFVCVTANGETKWRPVYDSIYLYQYYAGEILPPEPPSSNLPAE